LRLSVGVTATSTGSFISFVGPINDNGAAFNSTTTGNTIYTWGAQLEQTPRATGYLSTTVKNQLGYTQAFDNAAWTKSNSFIQTNLLTWSESFDNAAWTKASVTATANTAVSPDATTTADSLVENTTGGEHVVFQQTSKAAAAITYTHSIYYKAGTGSRNIGVAITDGTLGGLTAIFNTAGSVVLASQAVGIATGWAAVGAAVTAVGNGWFRASFTATTNTATRVDGVVYLVDGTTRSYTGNGTSSLLIWGAQLVQGATPGDYQATAASALAVQYTDPFGLANAEKLVESATASAKSLSQGITGVLGTVYTYSVYAKRAERKYLRIIGGSGSFNLSVNFDLDDGSYTITGGGGDVSAVSVGNGWYKCSITRSATSTSINPFLSMALTSTGAGDYTGDGTSGIYIYGAQL
jgi:hypothetical protein